MTQADLIRELSRRWGLPLGQTKINLEILAEVIGDELSRQTGLEERPVVPLPFLGRLKVSDRPARQGRNPKTGEPLTIPAKRAVKFVPAPGLAGWK